MRLNEIVLASASPRRRELLSALGVRVIVMPADIDETQHQDESPETYVVRLAAAKMRHIARRIEAGREPVTDQAMAVLQRLPVLAADTTVEIDGVCLGKPRDQHDALAMLQRLSGRVHHVITAVAACQGQREVAGVSVTQVHFRAISSQEAQAYWRSGECSDKAGAYGIQGLGGVFATRIDGSFTGVMGLPVAEVDQLLRNLGWQLLPD